MGVHIRCDLLILTVIIFLIIFPIIIILIGIDFALATTGFEIFSNLRNHGKRVVKLLFKICILIFKLTASQLQVVNFITSL